MNIKRCISLYLVFLLLLSFFPGVVYAADNPEFLEQSATENIDAGTAALETEATATPSIPPKEAVDTSTAEPETEATTTPSIPPQEEVVDTGAATPETKATATPSIPPKEEAADDSAPTPPTKANPPVVIGYNVSKSNIAKDDIITIKVTVKHTDVTAEQIGGKDNIDITKLVDSFSGGNVSVDIISNPNEMLVYEVTFSDVKYSGSGKSLRFMCGYKGNNESFSTMELSITEAVEYEKPPEPQPTTPEAAPAPMVLISRGEMKSSLIADQETSVSITFHNLDNRTITSVVATFSPSESLLIVGGNSSFKLNDIPGQKSQTITLKVRATKTVTSEAQSLGVELKFNYNNNIAVTQGSCSDRVIIPAVVTNQDTSNAAPAPMVLVSRGEMKSSLVADQETSVSITFHNLDSRTITSVVATFSPSESLLIVGGNSSFKLDDIPGQKSQTITLKVRATKTVTSEAQSLGVELKFNYNNNIAVTQGSCSDRVIIPAVATNQDISSASVPNIVVSDYSYNKEAVSAGEKFPLTFTLQNTGKLTVENIVVTIDGGDNFTIDGSTNTFHYDKIAGGGEIELTINMQALVSAKTGAQSIGIGCKYEYLDNNKRSAATADIKLSVPVFQPDRFQVNAPAIPEMISVGEEVTLSLSYVSKGKVDVGNVEAIIEGEVDTPTQTQYLGNFEPGKSGNIGFVFTPQKTGRLKLVLKINYENANLEVRTLEFPVTLDVQEAPEESMYPDDFYMEEDSGNGIGIWKILGGFLLTVFVVVVIIKIYKKRKKSHAALAGANEFNCDNWPDDGIDIFVESEESEQ